MVSVSTAMDLIRSCRYLDVICELVPCSQSQVCGHRCCRVSCRQGLGAHAAAGDSIDRSGRSRLRDTHAILASRVCATRAIFASRRSRLQNRSRRENSIRTQEAESRQTKDAVKSNWREDSHRLWKRAKDIWTRTDLAHANRARVFARSQLANMPKEASQMPSLLKWQTRL